MTHTSINADGSTTLKYTIDGQEYVSILPTARPSQEEQDAMKLYMETGNIPLDYLAKQTGGEFSTSSPVEEIIRRSIELAGK